MTRSVKQDYDKLRSLQSHGVIHLVSAELHFDLLAEMDPRYERKATKTIVASTAEDWAKYHLAKRALLTLKDYENTIGAEEVEIPCPKPKTEYHFLETVDEWLDRCRALRAERTAA